MSSLLKKKAIRLAEPFQEYYFDYIGWEISFGFRWN